MQNFFNSLLGGDSRGDFRGEETEANSARKANVESRLRNSAATSAFMLEMLGSKNNLLRLPHPYQQQLAQLPESPAYPDFRMHVEAEGGGVNVVPVSSAQDSGAMHTSLVKLTFALINLREFTVRASEGHLDEALVPTLRSIQGFYFDPRKQRVVFPLRCVPVCLCLCVLCLWLSVCGCISSPIS